METSNLSLLIVFSIFIIAFINIVLGKTLLNDSADIRILNVVNGFIVIHSIFLFTSDLFFKSSVWALCFSPFTLLYGPLLYYATASVYHFKPGSVRWMHGLPFIISSVAYVYIIIYNPSLESEFTQLYNTLILVATSVSLTLYVTLPFYNLNKHNNRVQNDQLYLITLSRIVLGFIAILMFTVLGNEEFESELEAAHMIQVLIYLCFLVMAITLFVFLLYHAKKHVKFSTYRSGATYRRKDAASQKYQKSLIPTNLMEKYAEKISMHFERYKYYREPQLNINKLSKYLNIPAHHLTQVFNLHYKQSFSEYVNQLRIAYAIELLNEMETDAKIETVAKASGFASRVSFNRHFKVINLCTPTEYLQFRVKKEDN